MTSAHIKKHFSSDPLGPVYQKIMAHEWRDWKWQLTIAESDKQKCFISHYYLNLKENDSVQCPIARLIDGQKYLYDMTNNLLTLSDDEIISKIEALNINTTTGIIEIFFPMLTVLPQRINAKLINSFKNKGQVIIHLSINHPKECSLEFFEACNLLADSGFILNNHMTLLKGVNDSVETVKELNLKLLMMRVRPYSIYLYEKRQKESPFFEVTRQSGVDIINSLRGWISGLAVPHLLMPNENNSFDAILPNYIKKSDGENFVFRNYKNLDYEYANY